MKSMYKTQNQLLLIFTLVILITGWGGWWFLNSFLKLENIALYPLIPSFFLVNGLSVINVLTNINRDNPQRVVNIYMIIKLSKFFLSAVLIIILYVLLKEKAKELIFTFGAFYFLYMLMELYFFSQTEKTDKQNRENGQVE
jgi:glucan phosphoethanolaminetransferase (alkaline phosphatase superfamily)